MLNMKQTLDIRQKRIEADEAKRRKLRMGQLISEAVPNLKAGSRLHQMALEDPDQFALISKAMGIPLNAGDQMQELVNDTSELYMRAQADPEDAYNRALEIKAERNKAGRETPQMDRWIDLMENDPQTGLTSLFVFHRSMNPENEDNKQQFGGQEMLKDEKGNLFFATSKRDPSTGEVKGVISAVDGSEAKPIGQLSATGAYGQTAQERVSQVGAESSSKTQAAQDVKLATEPKITSEITKSKKDAEDLSKYKSGLFESINSNSRLLNKYRFAIKQLNEGAETGPVINRLPNLKEQSILVDVVRKEIGMEVLGSGLLGVNPTDKDVEFALTTSIPDNLRPEALKRELERRGSILEDLNTAQEEYYRLVDEEGYTKGDILKLAKQRSDTTKKETAAERFRRLTGGQ